MCADIFLHNMNVWLILSNAISVFMFIESSVNFISSLNFFRVFNKLHLTIFFKIIFIVYLFVCRSCSCRACVTCRTSAYCKRLTQSCYLATSPRSTALAFSSGSNTWTLCSQRPAPPSSHSTRLCCTTHSPMSVCRQLVYLLLSPLGSWWLVCSSWTLSQQWLFVTHLRILTIILADIFWTFGHHKNWK